MIIVMKKLVMLGAFPAFFFMPARAATTVTAKGASVTTTAAQAVTTPVTAAPVAVLEPTPKTVSKEVQFAQDLSDMLSVGTIDDALAMFDSLPDATLTGELQTVKAALLLSAGRSDEASVLAKDLLAKNPNDLDVLQLNVMLAKQRGDASTKSTLLKQILAIDPNNADANIELGDEQALKRRYRDARSYFQKALLSEPNNTAAIFGYGKMSYYLERDSDARKSFERLLALNPSDAQALSYLGKLEGEAKRYRKALEYVNRALELEPENATYCLDKGTYSRYIGKLSDAEVAWKQAVEYDPDYFLGYAYLAGLYEEQERVREAMAMYRKVVEKNPQYYYAYESIGILSWHEGNWKNARIAFEKAYAAKKDDVSYALMIAACYWKEGNMAQMKKYTESVMKGMNRNNIEYWVVRMYHDQGGDGEVLTRISKEKIQNTRNKMLFYAALYYDLRGNANLAQKYYVEVANMQGPTIFEYRLAQWKLDGTAK